jgi:cytochrome b
MVKLKPHLLFITLMSMAFTTHAGWFSNNDDQKEHLQDLQNQLQQENHTNGQMEIVIIILATGVVVALVVGAAIGSKARKAAKEEKQ